MFGALKCDAPLSVQTLSGSTERMDIINIITECCVGAVTTPPSCPESISARRPHVMTEVVHGSSPLLQENVRTAFKIRLRSLIY
jgi:hypothetical protein